MKRAILVGGLLLANVARATPPDGGFHLEPKVAIDDVFGDSAEYRKIVDKFLALTEAMQAGRDDFARSVQAILAELRGPVEPNAKPRPRKCPEREVAGAYARALALGGDYLRAGRELTRFYDQVREWDKFGETVGLTPDYRAKVKKVVAQYTALLTDYREMKVALHDQLADELRFAGCDPEKLARAGGAARDEPWPQPGEAGAPGVTPPVDKSVPAPPPSEKAAPKPTPLGPIDALAPARSGVLFYVDNTRCQTATHVSLDGHPVGDVAAASRAAFATAPGPHDLCLVPDGGARKCGEPGTVRKAYLHEGWTIALRCD